MIFPFTSDNDGHPFLRTDSRNVELAPLINEGVISLLSGNTESISASRLSRAGAVKGNTFVAPGRLSPESFVLMVINMGV